MNSTISFTKLIVSLAVVGILSFTAAALAVEFSIENDGENHVGEIIIVVENDLFSEEPAIYCGIT